jgi:hypothetical protein
MIFKSILCSWLSFWCHGHKAWCFELVDLLWDAALFNHGEEGTFDQCMGSMSTQHHEEFG